MILLRNSKEMSAKFTSRIAVRLMLGVHSCTGIFVRIAAEAAEEEKRSGKKSCDAILVAS